RKRGHQRRVMDGESHAARKGFVRATPRASSMRQPCAPGAARARARARKPRDRRTARALRCRAIMKSVVILGGGTAGTLLANRLHRSLPADWRVRVVDPEAVHLYQPGLLFLPFGDESESSIVRPRERTLDDGVDWVHRAAVAIDPAQREVRLE